ncbi:hypothetical protein HTVC023P_gp42 [Pelagibacter phage HTVC023P]|nr:hypothetical protein HTVC023P_gp42 [Pelagibacter phage HTVC023P]
MYMGDVKSKTFIDSNASSNTYVAAAARPTTTFTLANTSFGTNTARKITATTLGDESTITVTIVGTDEKGTAATEVITLPGSATTTAGTTTAFLTITSATVSAQPAANVSLGMTADVFGSIFAGRTRVRQANVASGGAIGSVEVRDESISGDSLLTVRTTATEGDISTINIPQDGILYKDGAFVSFSEVNCNSVTVYFDA